MVFYIVIVLNVGNSKDMVASFKLLIKIMQILYM